MGMSASQARLLSITARLSDNEHCGQSVSYSKQRLADTADQIQSEYNAALDATKLTVLTGFSGAQANYTDISYNLMTSPEMATNTKQYVVTNTQGQALVTKQIADAYLSGNGDYNKFLAKLGYSQAYVGVKFDASKANETDQLQEQQKIHEAWDKYMTSVNGVGLAFGTDQHDFGFSWTSFSGSVMDGFAGYARTNENGEYVDKNGSALTNQDDASTRVYDPINYEGATKEQRQMYDYAMALTEAYLGTSNSRDLKNTSDPENNSQLAYYKNIFDRMQSGGFYCYTTTIADQNSDPTHYKYVDDMKKTPIRDNWSFESMLRQGDLRLEAWNTADKKFNSVTISDDQSIQEVKDERKIAQAEAEYTQRMVSLEKKDKRFDLELKKLDSEHNALQTEYESVKGVIDKNIEKTFNMFS